MDPYKVLGISPDATDDEVKKAYRTLAKQYHPDRYQNATAAVQEQADRKMKEINSAYDDIQRQRKGGGSARARQGYQSYQNYTGAEGYTGSAAFADIREMISRGLIMQAQEALERLNDRSAEWYYLYGIVAMRRGWFSRARQCFETACQMEPDNAAYQQAYQQVEAAFAQSATRGTGFNMGGGSTLCNLCSCMLCSSLCGGRFCFC